LTRYYLVTYDEDITSDFIVTYYHKRICLSAGGRQIPSINHLRKVMFSMKVTLIAGSNRHNATSTILLRYIESLLKTQHVSVAFIDLSELQLPLFSPDNWDFHPNVQHMLEAIGDGDGLILATPEYHGSISGALKNALDYVNVNQVAGKPVLAISSAGGPLGVSSLTHLQAIVRNLHGMNCPEWISIGHGTNTFGSDGVPLDAGMRERVLSSVDRFLKLTEQLTATVTIAAASTSTTSTVTSTTAATPTTPAPAASATAVTAN